MVLSVLLSLSFGMVEFGYFFFVKHTLEGAAREGARAAIVYGAANSDVNTAVQNVMNTAGLSNSGYTVTTSPADITTVSPAQSITVTVSCTWGTAGNGFRPLSIISATKVVQGTAVMRAEGATGPQAWSWWFGSH